MCTVLRLIIIHAKLCGTSNLAPSHRPYTRISWVCSVTQARRYGLRDIVYVLCPGAAKYGSIALQLLRCSSQFHVLSAFMKECRIPIISRYCNQSLAARDSLKSLIFFCRDSENLSITSEEATLSAEISPFISFSERNLRRVLFFVRTGAAKIP